MKDLSIKRIPPTTVNRDSNIELFRVIVMALIIAHHYVVNSEIGILMHNDSINSHSVFFNLFGAWGKTGINCFVLITGYFMCSSRITLRKYLKLYFEIIFYKYLIWFIFFICGASHFSVGLFAGLFPFTRISTSFTNAFMVLFLLIPFINVLISHLTRKQHTLLICLLLWIYTFLGMAQQVTYNYVSWFVVLYLIASYIRFYGLLYNDSSLFWGVVALFAFVISMGSIYSTTLVGMKPTYFFVSDCNHIMALILSVSSFMFFKNIKIKNNKYINYIAATTFGVFLIHTRVDIRHWLWYDIMRCGEQYSSTYFWLLAIGTVFIIYFVGTMVDLCRIHFIEKPFFRLLDSRLFTREKNICSLGKSNTSRHQ